MDRFGKGLAAGVAGGIAMNLWTLFAVFVLTWPVVRFIDWAAIILYGGFPRSHAEGVFALLMHLLWTGVLGIMFAYLLPHLTSKNYLLKGAIFGVTLGFIIYAIPTLLQMPLLKEHSFITVISNHTGGLIWGLTTAYVLGWLDKREKIIA